jgi:hypothetical protein
MVVGIMFRFLKTTTIVCTSGHHQFTREQAPKSANAVCEQQSTVSGCIDEIIPSCQSTDSTMEQAAVLGQARLPFQHDIAHSKTSLNAPDMHRTDRYKRSGQSLSFSGTRCYSLATSSNAYPA